MVGTFRVGLQRAGLDRRARRKRERLHGRNPQFFGKGGIKYVVLEPGKWCEIVIEGRRTFMAA